jgi:hypothetical protein
VPDEVHLSERALKSRDAPVPSGHQLGHVRRDLSRLIMRDRNFPSPSNKVWELRNIDRDPPGLVAR